MGSIVVGVKPTVIATGDFPAIRSDEATANDGEVAKVTVPPTI